MPAAHRPMETEKRANVRGSPIRGSARAGGILLGHAFAEIMLPPASPGCDASPKPTSWEFGRPLP